MLSLLGFHDDLFAFKFEHKIINMVKAKYRMKSLIHGKYSTNKSFASVLIRLNK